MMKLAIVHYMPLEYYPPVTNFLNCLVKEEQLKIKVWSCHNIKNRVSYQAIHKLKISRVAFPRPSDPKLLRFLKYLLFNFNCFIGLSLFRPHKILYYESYSAGPVYWYLKFFGKHTELLIHNHEYFDPEWYLKGMAVVKRYHQLEKSFLFDRAQWISLTNIDRVRLFLKDHGNQLSEKMRVLPNYPPKCWKSHPKSKIENSVLRTVFIGSLSLKTTYLKPYCKWIIAQEGKVTFDIFSYNIDAITKDYLERLGCYSINFEEKGVEYNEIPKLLSQYDVGLILYKAYTPNFKYNAPNKLFEYLTCHLQVWYAEELQGIAPYKSARVIPLNFKDFSTFAPERNGFADKITSNFIAEQALQPLIEQLKS